MPTISLCMIVKNEEQFLEQCLRSVQGLVDEIIIVDTGSIDRTKEIAARFTQKVYEFIWCDDFAVARNISLQHASGDWILVLDADEALAERDHLAIRELVASAATTVSGFILMQRNYFKSMEDLSYGSFSQINVSAAGGELGFIPAKGDSYAESATSIGWLPTPIVRLFRREPAALFSGRVHEDVSSSLSGQILRTTLPIHHYGKMNPETWKRKWDLYQRLGEKKAGEQEDYYAYFELGRQYLAGKIEAGGPALDQAKVMFEKSLALNDSFWLSWFNLGSIHLIQDDLDSARACLEKARQLNPQAPQIYLNLGVTYVRQKKYQTAVDLFCRGLQLNPQRADLYKNLGLCYLEMGQERDAVLVLRKAVELNPEYAKIIRFEKKG